MAKKAKRPDLKHCKVRLGTHPKAPWRVSFKAEQEGQIVTLRKNFATEDAAWAFAIEKDVETSNHGVRYGDIPPEARRAFDYFRDEAARLESLGVTVPRFEEIVSTALERIREAHEHAAKITVADAVESFIAYKKTRVGTRQLTDLETRLARFAKDLGDRSLASITTAEIEEWIGALKSRKNPDKLAEAPLLAPLSRNHYRANLANLFAYGAAPARAWCPRNPIADLEPERVEMTEPEAYSPEDAAKIMEAALARKPELVPVLSLGMFCGLRVSEALAIELSKIRQGTDEFRVTGKTGPRMVPLTDAARAWLFAQDRRKGKAWLKSERHFVDAIQELFTIAGVQQIDNGARHSFISYRTAETRDVARVADECGNSVSTIKNHYRQLVTAADAATFFSLRPESAGEKVVQFEEGRGVA